MTLGCFAPAPSRPQAVGVGIGTGTVAVALTHFKFAQLGGLLKPQSAISSMSRFKSGFGRWNAKELLVT